MRFIKAFLVPLFILMMALCTSCTGKPEVSASGAGQKGTQALGEKAEIFLQKLEVLENTQDDKEAQLELLTALESAPDDSIPSYLKARLYRQKAAFEQQFGDPETAISLSERAIAFYVDADSLSAAAKNSNALGKLFYDAGDYVQATEAYLRGLRLSTTAQDSTVIAKSLSNAAAPYSHVGDFLIARKYLHQSIALARAIGNSDILVSSHINLGSTYNLQGRLDSAMYFYKLGYTLAIDGNHDNWVSLSVINIADIYSKSKQYDLAIDFLLGYIEKDFRNNFEGYEQSNILVLLNLYEAYMGKKDYEKAEPLLQEVCELSTAMDFYRGKVYCLNFYSTFYEEQGNYEKALESHRAYKALTDQHLTSEATRLIQAQKTNQAILDKDAEIRSLQEARMQEERENMRRNTLRDVLIFGSLGLTGAVFLISRSNFRRKLAAQKQTIAESKLQVLQSQMNPHFIYNTVNGIQNYILKSNKIDAYNYLGKFAALLRIITRSTADIRIELNREVKLLNNYLELEKMRFRDAFTYQINISESLMSDNPEIPNMMIQPVVENAIIHGLSGTGRPGHLSVSITHKGNGLLAIIEDNGRGRAAAEKISANQPDRHLSLATVNSKERLAFLRGLGYTNAKVEIEDLFKDGQPAGTKVSIYLPFLKDLNLL